MKNFYRHGDVNLHPIKEVKGKEVEHNGSFVLAYGEVTGHKHVLAVKEKSDLKIFKDENGRLYISLTGKGILTHEEHKKIDIAPNNYEVVFEREKDWFSHGVRRVQD